MTDRGYPGLFVALDGMAGAGKTTIAHALGRDLRARGHRIHVTAEPTRDELGELARHGTDRYSGRCLACLIAADRYHHLHTEIRPCLARGEIVICDRYVASSYVLQQIDGVPRDFIASLNADADRPDLTVTMLVDPEVAAARIAVRGAHDRFQSGITASRQEAALFLDVSSHLARDGIPLLTIDTTQRDTGSVVRQLAEHITEFGRPRSSEE